MANFANLVSEWRSADRAYNRDCNLRWALHKPDAKRKRLRAASVRAYERMMNAVRTDLRFRIKQQSNPTP